MMRAITDGQSMAGMAGGWSDPAGGSRGDRCQSDPVGGSQGAGRRGRG
jgi:hypothetical protein